MRNNASFSNIDPKELDRTHIVNSSDFAALFRFSSMHKEAYRAQGRGGRMAWLACCLNCGWCAVILREKRFASSLHLIKIRFLVLSRRMVIGLIARRIHMAAGQHGRRDKSGHACASAHP
jgi:hypothetical protein